MLQRVARSGKAAESPVVLKGSEVGDLPPTGIRADSAYISRDTALLTRALRDLSV
jgi:hypothetical protein